MTFEVFLNFNDGKCREAMEFYAQVFKSTVQDVVLFRDMPSTPDYPIPESEGDRIMYATVKIGDKNIMFMDMSSDYKAIMGNNITPAVTMDDHAEIDRIANELANDGTMIMAPQKVSWSNHYAMITDKFGITWHVYDPQMPQQ